MTWHVFLTREAEEMLLAIRDRRVRKLLHSRAIKLQNSPEQQGKPLIGELTGLRSIRAVGQRYRIFSPQRAPRLNPQRGPQFNRAGRGHREKKLGFL